MYVWQIGFLLLLSHSVEKYSANKTVLWSTKYVIQSTLETDHLALLYAWKFIVDLSGDFFFLVHLLFSKKRTKT